MSCRIRRYGCLGSTQDMARRLIAEEQAVGLVVVADEQTAGRGRRGRAWLSPEGGLYVSVVLPVDELLPLRATVAVADALIDFGVPVVAKWPNDVLVDGKKIAGILIERSGPWDLVGIGINVESAPLSSAACVCEYGEGPDSIDRLLGSILRRLLELTDGAACQRYRELLSTLGRTVRVEIGTGAIEGTAIDLDENGGLVVRCDTDTMTIVAGECSHLDQRVEHV